MSGNSRACAAGERRAVLIEKETMGKISILREFWDFLRVRKKWWLAPIIIFLVLLGALIILTEGSALAPFVYTLF
jgi:hypothetical protein